MRARACHQWGKVAVPCSLKLLWLLFHRLTARGAHALLHYRCHCVAKGKITVCDTDTKSMKLEEQLLFEISPETFICNSTAATANFALFVNVSFWNASQSSFKELDQMYVEKKRKQKKNAVAVIITRPRVQSISFIMLKSHIWVMNNAGSQSILHNQAFDEHARKGSVWHPIVTNPAYWIWNVSWALFIIFFLKWALH